VSTVWLGGGSRDVSFGHKVDRRMHDRPREVIPFSRKAEYIIYYTRAVALVRYSYHCSLTLH
jgi:hypothetical protein